MRGAVARGGGSPLGVGTRGRGSEPTASPVWGLSQAEYMNRCDPWPLNPEGELLLGVKLESPEGIANCESILAVPGIGFAELGPGDLGLALGYIELQPYPYPPAMQEARQRVFAACRKNRVAFLEGCTPEDIRQKLDEGVRVIAGHREDTARIGRVHQRRTMPV
jgi:4-hydroxy-2-oxoheptanedioate aldolase